MKKSLLFVLILAVIGGSFLTGCDEEGNSESGEKEKKFVIGISQIAEHPALDAAVAGFKEALADNGFKEGDNVSFDLQNAQGDEVNSKTIAENFVGDDVDLILANSTPSAVDALAATKDNPIPIVFVSVTDPVGAELAGEDGQPGENITGKSDYREDVTDKTISFIIDEIKAKNIGIIYNAGEPNSVTQVKDVKKLVEAKGGKLEEVTVANDADVKVAAESLVGKVDAIYVPTDNTVVSGIEAVITIANDMDIPLFAADVDTVEKGALAASGIDYNKIGYEAGVMAAQILSGEKKVSEINWEPPNEIMFKINKAAAAEQGVEVKDEWSQIGEFYEG